jgi:hypothetical protein
MAITIFVLLATRKRLELSHAVITISLALISLTAFRYIPFFMYATIPIVAAQATLLINDRPYLRNALNGAGVFLLLLAMAYVTALGYKTTLKRTIENPIATHRFPVEGAQFVKKYLPPGNIYNNFEWGGYLTWALYPEYRVFIDGRALNRQAFTDAMNMMWDSPNTPLLFDKYGVDMIMIPRYDKFTGEFYTVIDYLYRDSRWRLVYADEMTLIFSRRAV